MNIQLTIPQWLDLSPEVRAKLKEIFGIPRSSGTMVEDNRVITDGYTHGDLAYITIEKMQYFTGMVESDFFKLFQETVKILDTPLPAAPVDAQASPIIAKQTEELYINHNGKTYLLTEVPAQPVSDSPTLYPVQPKPEGEAPAEAASKAAPRKRGKAAGSKGTKGK